MICFNSTNCIVNLARAVSQMTGTPGFNSTNCIVNLVILDTGNYLVKVLIAQIVL